MSDFAQSGLRQKIFNELPLKNEEEGLTFVLAFALNPQDWGLFFLGMSRAEPPGLRSTTGVLSAYPFPGGFRTQ